MKQVFLSFGSNLSLKEMSSFEIIDNMPFELLNFGLVPKLVSNIYSSPAWPEGSGAPDYYNSIIAIETKNNDPINLLRKIWKIENKYGRIREIEDRWSPRTLDIDIIDFKGMIMGEFENDYGFILPHPRCHERAFVLKPLLEIAPDWVNPSTNVKGSFYLENIIDINTKIVKMPVKSS